MRGFTAQQDLRAAHGQVGDDELKPGELADRSFGSGALKFLRAAQDEFAGHAPVANLLSFNLNDEPVAAGVVARGHVASNGHEPLLQTRHIIGLVTEADAQVGLRLMMLAAQPGEARDFGVDAGLLDDERIAGGDGLDLGVSEGCAIDILDAAQVAFARHHLRDEPRFALQHLPEIGVETLLGHVAMELHFRVRVALAQDAALALFDIGRPPRRIEMMQRDEPFLHVGAGTHLLRAAEENADFAGAHVAKQIELRRVAVVILHELDLGRRHAEFHQLVAHVFINGEALAPGRRGEITEDPLRGTPLRRLAPDACNLRHGAVDLAVGMIGEGSVMQPQVERGFPSVGGDEQHVVLARIHAAGAERICPFY